MIYLIQLINLFKSDSESIRGLKDWIETIDNYGEGMEFIEYLDDMYGIEIPESGHDRFIQLLTDQNRVNAAFNMFAA